MKFPMAWHKKNAENSTLSLIGHERELARMLSNIEFARASHNFYIAQIAEAEKRGVDGFDPERFMVKRRA